MKTKEESSTKLQQYLIYIEKQHSYIPKRIRMDQGREYMSTNFCTWCLNKGIKIEPTVPYSSAQTELQSNLTKPLLNWHKQ